MKYLLCWFARNLQSLLCKQVLLTEVKFVNAVTAGGSVKHDLQYK